MSPRKRATQGPVRWEEVRHRMDALGSALEDGATLSAAKVREVLAARARTLARSADERAGDELIEVVTFALATERYAIESRYVVEVFRLADLALLPGSDAPALGVAAWRGGLLTVLDLRPLLGIPVAALSDLGRVVVLGEAGATFGFLADAVLEVAHLRRSEVCEPAEGVAVKRDFVRGVTGEALIMLDAGKLLRIHS